jgi:hypothetical protein
LGEVPVDEFDGSRVVAAVAAEQAAEGVVDLIDVNAVEATVAGDAPLEFKGHLRHVPERASARGLGDPNVAGIKLGERACRSCSARSSVSVLGRGVKIPLPQPQIPLVEPVIGLIRTRDLGIKSPGRQAEMNRTKL